MIDHSGQNYEGISNMEEGKILQKSRGADYCYQSWKEAQDIQVINALVNPMKRNKSRLH